jgi:CubicO group peptidase (beta-lactamase class C family)
MAGIFVMLLATLHVAAAQGARASATEISRAVDSIAALGVTAGLTPAIGVAVTMDGRTIYAKSHGYVDVSAKIPADDRTLWYVASTSKSFTGFGVSLLANEGVIRFDAPITTLLPNVRWHEGARAQELTLAHFLSHTHHLNDNAVVSSAAFTGEIPEARWPSLVALATPTGNNDLVYSNFGYNVAAMVIDRVRPEGWRKYLEERVYEPAGLREIYARVSGLDARRIAKPHSLRADGSYKTEPFYKTDATMNSAGGHIATLGDLARWTIVQMDSGRIDGKQVFPTEAVDLSHRLIARQTRDQAKRFAFFDREGWGAGWDLGTYEGERMVSRFGGYFTTRSHLSFLPRRRIGVVAMSTGGAGSNLVDIIAALVYDLEAGRPNARERVEKRLADLRAQLAAGLTRIAADDSVRASRQRQPLGRSLSDFAGSYAEPSFGTVSFSVKNGRLEYRWGAVYGPAEIYDAAKSQLRIEIAGSGNVVTFTFPSSGAARSIELQGMTFTRVN